MAVLDRVLDKSPSQDLSCYGGLNMKSLLTGLPVSVSLALASLVSFSVSSTFAAEGDYLVGNATSAKTGELLRVTPDGVITTIVDGLGGPVDIIVDSNSDLIIADLKDGRLLRVTLSGAVTVIADRLDFPDTFNGPYGVDIDANGDFIVAHSLGSLLRVTPEGDVTTIFESVGDFVTDFAIDTNGDYIVAVARDGEFPLWSSKLLRVKPDGTVSVIRQNPVFQLTGVAIASNGDYIVATASGGTVDRISPNRVESFPTGCFDARKVAIDADGNYIVTCPITSDLDQLIRITPSGFVTVVASGIDLGFPIGIAIEPSVDPILDLIAKIEQLVEDDVLNEGEGQSLIVKLTGAEANLESDDISGACGKLAAFINEVTAIMISRRLSETQGQELINAVNAIRDSIPCSDLSLAPSAATDSQNDRDIR